MHRAIFLDRDNTIIHNDGDLGDPDQVRLIQGAAMAIASLCGLAFKVVVVTNQGGVARGRYTEDDVLLVHERIAQMVAHTATGARIDRFYYCPYHPDGAVDDYRCEHPWRKPQPGMLLQAAEDLNIDLGQSWMIGDQMRDIQAGAAAGCRTILLRPDAAQLKPLEDEPEAPSPTWRKEPQVTPVSVKPDYIVRSLVEAVRIIAQRKPESAEDTRNAVHVVGKRWDAAAVKELQRSLAKAAEARGVGGDAAAGEAEPAAHEVEARTGARREGPPRATRPFRPWGAAAPEETERIGSPTRERPADRRAVERQAAAEAPPQSAETTPDTDVRPTEPLEEGDFEEGATVLETRAAGDDEREPRHAGATREPSPPWHGMDQTLRLVLQELRNQRGGADEFNVLTVVAMVMQTLAAVCLLGGLWMGAGDDGLFLRWIGAGLFVQLATIAVLLFGRQR